jgi:hypothetical protein
MYFTINKLMPSAEKDGYPDPRVIDFENETIFPSPCSMDKSAYTYQRLYASFSIPEPCCLMISPSFSDDLLQIDQYSLSSGYHRFYVRLHHGLHPTDLHIVT